MTEFHNYNTPAQGETNWHDPLNENFEEIDRDIEIRGTESAIDDYTPTAGSKFLATDTGRVFVADGDEWQDIQLTDTEKYLEEGFIVGVANGQRTVVDPRDVSSDAQAIQQANDELVDALSSSNDTGHVYLPSQAPDGSPLAVDETVVFGSESEPATIFPRGWGFVGSQSPAIRCRIDNGDPMFVVASNSNAGEMAMGNTSKFGGFAADAAGRDAEFLRLKNVNAFHLTGTHARHFNTKTADGVYVFDGACYNSYINKTSFVSASHNCPNADIWVMRNDTGDGPPGELKFGIGNTTYADPSMPFNTAYKQTVDCSGMVFNGRVEGAGGPAMIYVTDGYLSMSCTELDRVEGPDGTTDKVYFSGKKLAVGTAVTSKTPNQTGGDIFRIAGGKQIRIAPFQDDGTSPGNSINIETEGGGSNVFLVPYESSLRGTISYPSEPWNACQYPDGWQRFRSGQTQIEANSTTTLTNYAGDEGAEIKLTNLRFVNDPDGDVEYQKVFGWRESSGDSGKQVVKIKETAGTSFTLAWALHRRP